MPRLRKSTWLRRVLGGIIVFALLAGSWIAFRIIARPSGIMVLLEDGRINVDGRSFSVAELDPVLDRMIVRGRYKVCIVGGANWFHEDVRHVYGKINRTHVYWTTLSPQGVSSATDGIVVRFGSPLDDWPFYVSATNVRPFKLRLDVTGTTVGGVSVDAGQITALVKESLAANPVNPYAVLECEPLSRHQALLDVVQILRSAGLQRIYVVEAGAVRP